MAQLTIIQTASGMLLSKRSYRDERAIQDEFDGYKGSFGPYSLDALFDYLGGEYPAHHPFTREQITGFCDGSEDVLWSERAATSGGPGLELGSDSSGDALRLAITG